MVSLIFVLLLLSVVFTVFRRGNPGRFAVYFRLLSVLLALIFYGYKFYMQSTEQMVKDALSVQIINSLPQPLDFYLITKTESKTLDVKHLEEIRPDFFRITYDTVHAPHKLWVAGFLGKKNMVYFSEKQINNHAEDQIIEVKNYSVENEKLSEVASAEIEKFRHSGVKSAVFITLTFLMLFINLYLLLKDFGKRFV